MEGVELKVEWRDDRLRLELHERHAVLPWTPSLLARAATWLRGHGVRASTQVIEDRLWAEIVAQTISHRPQRAELLRAAGPHGRCVLLCTSVLDGIPAFAGPLEKAQAAVFAARILDRVARSVPRARRRLRRWQRVFQEGSGAGLAPATVERYAPWPNLLWRLRALTTTVEPQLFASLSLVARIVETVETFHLHDEKTGDRGERPVVVEFFALPRVRRAVDNLLSLDDAAARMLWRPILASRIPREAVLLEHVVARSFLVGLTTSASDDPSELVKDGLREVTTEGREARVDSWTRLPGNGRVARAIQEWFTSTTIRRPRIRLNLRRRVPVAASPPVASPPHSSSPSPTVRALLGLLRLRQPSIMRRIEKQLMGDGGSMRVMSRRRFWELGLDRHLSRRVFRLTLSWYGSSRDISPDGVADLLVDWERLWAVDDRATPALRATLSRLDAVLAIDDLRRLLRVTVHQVIPTLHHLRAVMPLIEITNAELRDMAIARVCGLDQQAAELLVLGAAKVAERRRTTDSGALLRLVVTRAHQQAARGADWAEAIFEILMNLHDAEPLLAVQRQLGWMTDEPIEDLLLPLPPAMPPAGTRMPRNLYEFWAATAGDRSKAAEHAAALVCGQAWAFYRDATPYTKDLVIVGADGSVLWSSSGGDPSLAREASAWAVRCRTEAPPDTFDWTRLHRGATRVPLAGHLEAVALRHRRREVEATAAARRVGPTFPAGGSLMTSVTAFDRLIPGILQRPKARVIAAVVEHDQWSMQVLEDDGVLLVGRAPFAMPRIRFGLASRIEFVVRSDPASGRVEALWLGEPWARPLSTVGPQHIVPGVIHGVDIPGRHILMFVRPEGPAPYHPSDSRALLPLLTTSLVSPERRGSPRFVRRGSRISLASDAFMTVGSKANAVDIVVDGPYVSEQHLLLWPRSIGWEAIDLATPYGTHVERRLAVDLNDPVVELGCAAWDLPDVLGTCGVSLGSRLTFGGGTTLEIDLKPPD